jgi:CheY-like chemotaxis protein
MRDPEQILAWLEELGRIRSPLELFAHDKDLLPIPAKVELVGEETRAFTLSLQRLPQPEPKAGQAFLLNFHLDGQRFRTEVAYQGRGGYMQCVFRLPQAVLHAERRSALRTRFGTREKAQVVALQGLFEGLALGGALVNLSLGGCAMRLSRAMDIRGDKRLALSPDLLPEGTPLALLRIQDLPHSPMIECGATVSHMEQRSEGVVMGLRFEGLGSYEAQIIGKLLTQRVPGFRRSFPRKRRLKDLSEAERQAPQVPEEPIEAHEDEEVQAPTEAESALSDLEIEELRLAVRAPDRTQLLKKRGKRILLLVGDELDRAILMATLHVDGYRSLYEAQSLVQALDVNRRAALDMVIVDQKVGPHGALEIVEALRAGDLAKGTPILVLQRKPEVRLAVAAKAGGISLVLEHPVDFDGRLKPALEGLLGLV